MFQQGGLGEGLASGGAGSSQWKHFRTHLHSFIHYLMFSGWEIGKIHVLTSPVPIANALPSHPLIPQVRDRSSIMKQGHITETELSRHRCEQKVSGKNPEMRVKLCETLSGVWGWADTGETSERDIRRNNSGGTEGGLGTGDHLSGMRLRKMGGRIFRAV